ncbi:tripartite tricarboxylate transporter permease [Paragemmobacter ruber]|uniref:Tripartite tricarboxylate transporter permease n=1 Tax=Paragemmobacter ruber TaxID=1985673 RepID=A0ABW9Y100_9RHOB|nr:tripartite tricarboxylate transporter permease [Rhodobacter ruber]NBE06063.1 tripartite tricarboxylate transporter permease [Rhodobacter ruber]
MIEALLQGFSVAMMPENLLFIFIGVLIGQVVGALPGVGPAAGMALLLPLTFGLEPVTAIMMLAGIMYGGQYGGTLTSVLINVPGEASGVMTAMDGHAMARQGRAGAALAIAAIGSFIAGLGAVLAVAVITPPLASIGLKFNAPEYFLLALLGVIAVGSLGDAPIRSLLAGVLGLLIALVGVDPLTGTPRLNFGIPALYQGIDFIPVAIGVFGIAEVLHSLERSEKVEPIRTRLKDMWLTSQDWAACRFSILRGGVIGLFVGIMPGAGASVASLLSYLTERKFSKHPERFGSGAIDGVAAAESANNAASHGALIPMLSLGIPGSASSAVLLAALILHGIKPGPMLMSTESALVWGLIASMVVGNLFLLILNLPMAPVFAALLRVPYVYLAPGILVISLVGAYAATLSMATVWMCIVFGLLGWLMMKLDIPRAPLVLALVLAPLMEASLRQALLLSLGSPMIFVERPISAVLLAAVLFALIAPIVRVMRKRP